jgi:hypothetical protein
VQQKRETEREIEKKSQWKDKQREIEEIIAASSYKPQKFVDRYDEQGGPKRHDAEHNEVERVRADMTCCVGRMCSIPCCCAFFRRLHSTSSGYAAEGEFHKDSGVSTDF